MEVRGGGIAGGVPRELAPEDATRATLEPVSSAAETDSRRSATSKADDGAGVAEGGTSSRQPDQDGPDDGVESVSPWQRPASQQAIFTGQWQPCAPAFGGWTLVKAASGRSSVVARTARSAPALPRDLILPMTDRFYASSASPDMTPVISDAPFRGGLRIGDTPVVGGPGTAHRPGGRWRV